MSQGITLSSFASQTLGGTYGNPEPTLVRNKGTYQGECVSYVKQYLSAMFGVNWGSVGNAVDYANSANQERFKSIGFTWKPGDTNFKDGDILVWGDDAGTWTGPAGHIAIWYGGRLLNQNYNNSLKVSQDNFFSPGYLGRYTGGTMDKITKEQEQVCAIMQTGSKPGKNYNYRFTGLPLTQTNLDQMLQFWSRQGRPSDWNQDYEPVNEQLYRKK